MSGDPFTSAPGSKSRLPADVSGTGSWADSRVDSAATTGPAHRVSSSSTRPAPSKQSPSPGSAKGSAAKGQPPGELGSAGTTDQPSPAGAVVTAVPTAGAGAVRRARLTVSRVDPWSVMKMSFVLSLAGAIVLVVAVWLLWLLLVNGDVFVSVDQTIGDIAGSGSAISVVDALSLRRVMGIALMLSVVQVVLVTALATLMAFLYNLASGLVGGFEVTLSEDA